MHVAGRIVIALHGIFNLAVARLGYRELISDLLLLLCLIIAWYRPKIGSGFFDAVERFGTRFAERRALAIVSLAAAAILIRLSLLWLLPIPIPRIADEFSYLLAADTFAHGRLTNPTHPLWVFFDTVHVLQQPTYMSKYQPAQGAVLAAGQLLGHPWIGVLLSVGLMCAALLWMLQGWLPSRWALLGGVLAMFRLGISSYWVDSYWGGAVAATGGALVVGALPRIMRYWRTRDALLLALGAAILANSRPMEGLLICAPVMAILFWQLCSNKSPSLRVSLARVIMPFLGAMILCGIFTGYYNWRLTSHPLLFPEELHFRQYSVAPAFLWQKIGPPAHYQNPQFESVYNGWARQYSIKNRVDSVGSAAKHLVVVVMSKFVYFFLWPELCVPLLAVPWMLGDRRVRYLIFQFVICLLGWFSAVWFLPHYAAPATAIIFALLVQSARHVRRWEFHGRRVGIGLTRAMVLFAVILAPLHQRAGTLEPVTSKPPTIGYRAKFAADLAAMPGEHLALVRYGVSVDSGEWVYNAADIDHAKIVWAREIPGIDDRPLLDYFRGRRVWLVEPDAIPPRITPYNEPGEEPHAAPTQP
jgi:hypothetical protein